MSRAKKPLTDDALAAMVAERIAELEAVIKVHEAGIVAAKAALAKLRPSEGVLVPGQLLGSLSVNFTEAPAPKRVVVGAHKAVRVEDTGAPDGGRPSPAPDAFPPSGAREAGSTGALECASPSKDPLEVPAFLKRTG